MPLTNEILARRLKEARIAVGVSQAQAAEVLGIMRPAISQIETGDRKVGSLELDKLASLYGRLSGDLLEEEFDPDESLLAAFRAVGAQGLEWNVQQAVIDRCRKIAKATRELEEALDIGPPLGRGGLGHFGTAPTENTWQAIQQGENAAILERRRLGLGQAPVPDLVDLLEAQGILTATLNLPEGVDGLTLILPDGPFVAINRQEPTLPRRRFSLAHEYGHVILDARVRASVTHRDFQDDVREKRANRFAAAFLLPEEGVVDLLTSVGKPPRSNTSSVMEGGHVYSMRNTNPASDTEIQPHDVVHLSHYFGASHLAVLYRLKSLAYLSEQNLQKLMSARESGVLKKLSSAFFDERNEAAPSASTPDRFHRRFLALLLEALRRDEISLGHATDYAVLAGFDSKDFHGVVQTSGVAPRKGRIRNPRLGE